MHYVSDWAEEQSCLDVDNDEKHATLISKPNPSVYVGINGDKKTNNKNKDIC